MLARNLKGPLCEGTLGNQISLAWANYEWRGRHHFALELLLSAVCGLLQSVDTASGKELVVEARTDCLRDPAPLAALWPEAEQAWGRSALDAFSSVPADLMAGRALPFPAFTEMRASASAPWVRSRWCLHWKSRTGAVAKLKQYLLRWTSDLGLPTGAALGSEPLRGLHRHFCMERCAIIPHLQVTLRKMAGGQEMFAALLPEGQRLRLTANQSGAGFSNSRLDNTINLLVDIGVFRRRANGEISAMEISMSEANVVERLCATVQRPIPRS